jgi:hypothetical protein
MCQTYEHVYTSKYSDLSFELGLTQYSQDMLLKWQPQREKATVFGSNTTHNRVFSVVTQSYSVISAGMLKRGRENRRIN